MPTNLEQQADLLFENINVWETSTLERIGKRIKKIGKMSVADVQALNNRQSTLLSSESVP